MKLRIRGDTIRLRLTQTEVATLAEKGIVEDSTSFAPSRELVYAIAFGPELGATLEGPRVEVTMPSDVCRVWATGDSVGVEGTQKAADGRILKLLIEKDWNCLKPREGEDDGDAFPNPG